MYVQVVFALSLIASAVSAESQSIAASVPKLPGAPRAMLIAAKTLYDYNDSTLKPWHLAGTYEMFDDSGILEQKGKYELWWKEPGVYRSSWSRGRVNRSEWHTADGKTLQQSTGDRLFYFEHALERFLISPLPNLPALDNGRFEIKKDQMTVNKLSLPCVEIKARAPSGGGSPIVPGVQAGGYCFDPSMPVLRIEHLFESVYVEFNQLTRNQNRVLPREITIADRSHKLLTFEVETSGDLGDAEALKPPSDAAPFFSSELPYDGGILKEKIAPSYPPLAKAARISGTVILDAMIAKDGSVNDVRVLTSPVPWLSSASKDAVAQWRYAPFVFDGQPQEVNTIINVVFFPARE